MKDKAKLLDLDAYEIQPEDGAVVAWPIEHTTPDRRRDKRDIRITIKAQLLKKSSGGTANLAEEARESQDDKGTSEKDEL